MVTKKRINDDDTLSKRFIWNKGDFTITKPKKNEPKKTCKLQENRRETKEFGKSSSVG
jgi:hypothetical protein